MSRASMPFRGYCVWCGKEVWARRVVQEVVCWEVERLGGGAHAIHGPDKKYTGNIMHSACHDLALLHERNHIIPGQLTIEE